jgi:hypothetical protein
MKSKDTAQSPVQLHQHVHQETSEASDNGDGPPEVINGFVEDFSPALMRNAFPRLAQTGEEHRRRSNPALAQALEKLRNLMRGVAFVAEIKRRDDE